MTTRRLIRAILLAAPLLLLAGAASAGDLDTIFLVNGGRLRGVVFSDDPSGVEVRLPDGTTRKLPRAEVSKVQYGSDAPASAPAAPAPAPSPAGPAAGTPAPLYYPAPGAGYEAPRKEPTRQERRTGLLVTGLILMPLGVAGLAVSGGVCSQVCVHSGSIGAVAAAFAGSGTFLAMGLIFTIVGAQKRTVSGSEDARLTLSPVVGPSTLGFRGAF